MVRTIEPGNLQDRAKELLRTIRQAEELGAVREAASQVVSMPGANGFSAYLVREALGARAALMNETVRLKVLEDLQKGEVNDCKYVESLIDAMTFGNPELRALFSEHRVDAKAVRLGYLGGPEYYKRASNAEHALLAHANEYDFRGQNKTPVCDLPSGRRIIPPLFIAFLNSNDSTADWVNTHALTARDLDRLLNYVGHIAQGAPVKLTDQHAETARLALHMLQYPIHDSHDDRQKELLKDSVVQGLSKIEEIALRQAGTGGVGSAFETAVEEFRRLREVKRSLWLPRVEREQDVLHYAAEKEARAGDENGFKTALQRYDDFSKAYWTALDEDKNSYDASIAKLRAKFGLED